MVDRKPAVPSPSDRRRGLLLGLVGVLAFSGTLPATRLAVAYLDPVFVGLGRALVAAVLAAAVLIATRTPWPARAAWPRLALVAAGVVVGWPVLSAFAMRQVPAAHGAVVSGLLPLATALAGAWLAHERPSRRFWICALSGSAVVVAFALWEGGGAPQLADLLLVGQTQLLQPFFTIFASAWLLHEPVGPATFVAAGLVVAAIALGRR